MIYWFWHGYTVDSGSRDVLNRDKNCTALQEHKQIGYLKYRKIEKYVVLIIQKTAPNFIMLLWVTCIILSRDYWANWKALWWERNSIPQFLCGLKGATNSFLFPLNRSPAKPRWSFGLMGACCHFASRFHNGLESGVRAHEQQSSVAGKGK